MRTDKVKTGLKLRSMRREDVASVVKDDIPARNGRRGPFCAEVWA